MDKLVAEAFRKMEQREHRLRVSRDRMGLKKITKEEFRKEEAAIIDQFKLTNEERLAYDRHISMRKKDAK